MYSFSNTSKKRLETCDKRLQAILNELIKYMDVTILCGHRSEQEQNEALSEGRSKVAWPDSKHNSNPSLAVDVAPWVQGIGIPWNDTRYFYYMAGMIKVISESQGVKIRFGGDWNSDGDFGDQTFNDLPHFEIVE